MIRWWFDSGVVDARGGHPFGSLDRIFSLKGDLVAKDPFSNVLRVEFEGRRYYVKRYQGNGKNLKRRWFGFRQWIPSPRVKKEWENLLAFQRWEIPTAQLMAYGLERHFGGFRRGALVTEEIVGAVDLAQLAREDVSRFRDSRWANEVISQVARITRLMHQAKFAHNDLKWRNLLVVDGAVPRVYLIDCPSGGYWLGLFLRYRILKDLACLDKVAKYTLTRTQRMRFYLEYVQRERLLPEDKPRLRKILRFFEGRE